jgi:hypothetical protein
VTPPLRSSLQSFYEQRKAELTRSIGEAAGRSDVISRRRGLIVLGAIPIAVYGIARGMPTWGYAVLAALAAAFTFLVLRHAVIATEKSEIEERLKATEAGLRRISGEPEPDDPYAPRRQDPHGLRFLKPDHPNAGDLDLFGPTSIFASVSRAETAVGEETLAGWLTQPASVEDVAARQAAAKELLQHPAFLEDLIVLARRAESRGKSEEPLSVWGEAPAELPVPGADRPELATRKLLVAAARVVVPLTIVLFAARPFLAEIHPRLGTLALAPILVQVSLLAVLYGPIARMVTFVSSRESPFGRFRAVFSRVEGAGFESPLLRRIVQTLRGDGEGGSASAELARLERIVSFADLRHNTLIHLAVNLTLLYDVWVALALERWRARSGKKARRWLAALGELEALASIATYAGEHPTYAWPDVDDGPARLRAEDLGHPLIPEGRCVRNAAELSEPGRALLVTGSNMSGKSTYLRSLGLCAVMALAGLPVCARRASLSRVETWTSMRIADALEQGMSHFYAELVRLKAIVDASHAGKKVLFLLDEILHGTNSRERTIGARAVVLDLVSRGTIGAVSTHDFALVTIADESGGRVETVHFSDRLEDGRMLFDYKLRPGVVQSTNAIRLMREVGIDVAYGVE